MKNKIAPSMMCADAMRLGETLTVFEKCGIEYLHIDIMDGVFVPNLTLGTDYCKMLKRNTSIQLDIHLMITEPESKLSWFEFGKGDYVSVHAEATDNLSDALKAIRSRGARPMVAISPDTPVSLIEDVLSLVDGVLVMTVNPGFAGQKMIPATLGKITELRGMLDEKGYGEVEIEVDGNVSFENALRMRDAGANIFVGGTSSVFYSGGTLEENIARMRESL
ncbi:MAG: ribulose-phosphate 3-epimerase [Clostridia bacterium]|nr:ribulose-phosphate 3-epimerase [Clostridia bacterium]